MPWLVPAFVWENGRFDFKKANLDEPQWMIPLATLAGLNLTSTIDALIRTVYLSYIDAATLVISDNELFSRADVHRPATRRRYESRAIDSFLDLNDDLGISGDETQNGRV